MFPWERQCNFRTNNVREMRSFILFFIFLILIFIIFIILSIKEQLKSWIWINNQVLNIKSLSSSPITFWTRKPKIISQSWTSFFNPTSSSVSQNTHHYHLYSSFSSSMKKVQLLMIGFSHFSTSRFASDRIVFVKYRHFASSNLIIIHILLFTRREECLVPWKISWITMRPNRSYFSMRQTLLWWIISETTWTFDVSFAACYLFFFLLIVTFKRHYQSTNYINRLAN